MRFRIQRVYREPKLIGSDDSEVRDFKTQPLVVVVTKDVALARDVLAIWYRRRYGNLPTRPRGGMFVAEEPEGGDSAVICFVDPETTFAFNDIVEEL